MQSIMIIAFLSILIVWTILEDFEALLISASSFFLKKKKPAQQMQIALLNFYRTLRFKEQF